jgi:DNA-binding winged helix-turn-helix (wHTH) protein/Tol biopolymer transport system component
MKGLSESEKLLFRFADIEVRESEFLITRAGQPLPVEPKVMRLLLYMLRRPGQLIGKDELLDAVWNGTVVSENSLTRNVAYLRHILGDDPRTPRYIATVSSLGYRFICPVEAMPQSLNGHALEGPQSGKEGNGKIVGIALPDCDGSVADPPARSTNRLKTKATGIPWLASRRTRWLTACILLILGLAATLRIWLRPLPPPRIAEYKQLTNDGRKKDILGTDGERLYLRLADSPGFGHIPVTGGRVTPVTVQLSGVPSLAPNGGLNDVSPDGASVLMPGEFHLDDYNVDLWSVGIEGHPSRLIGRAFSSTWSNDGRSLLYSDIQGRISVVSSAGGEPHEIFAWPAKQNQIVRLADLSWSPNNSRIRFTEGHRIWEISGTGANLHELLPGWNASLFMCCGRWTPDGAYFLFLSGDTHRENLFMPAAQIWALDQRQSLLHSPPREPVRLTAGPMLFGKPIPSMDGRTVFSRGTTQRGELVRFNSQTRQFEPFLGGISAESVAFSPDGMHLAYVSFPDGILWMDKRDGTEPVQLSRPPLYPRTIRWSPDGTQILFTDTSPGGMQTMYVVSYLGGPLARLLPADNNPESDPAWSPGGEEVVYCTNFAWSADPSDREIEIRIADLHSHTTTTLPPAPGPLGGTVWSPRWSPDGLLIAAIAGPGNLALFDLKRQQWKLLGASGDFPTFSHDGRFLYFIHFGEETGVYRIPVKGGKIERIVDLKGFRHTGNLGFYFGLDPDDSPLLLRDVGHDELYALTLERK